MKKQKPELLITLILFVIGTVLLLITPAGANYDEETYIARIWEMNLGYFLPNEHLQDGGSFPNAFLKISYRRQINVPVINMDILREQIKETIYWQDFAKHETRAGYFPTLFIIQAAIMRVFGAHFHLPVLIVYYLLRFSYLLIYCMLIYLSLKVLPFGKWLFGVLALTPMCLVQVTSISADPPAFGMAFLFTAWILKLAADPQPGMTKKELLVTSLLILAVGTLKTNMIFLLALLFLIPIRKLDGAKSRLVVLISVLASLALAFGWIMITAQVFNTERTDLGINPGERLLSIFTDPLEFLKNLAVTLSGRLAIFYKQAVGVSGYGYWRMPAIVYWLFPVAVLLALFSEGKKITLSIRQRILFALVGLFNIAAIFVIFYVVETPLDYNGIWGIQGRYFTPFLPLLLIPFLFKSPLRLPPALPVTLSTLIAVLSVGALFLAYHAICGATWFNQNTCSYPYYKNWDPSTFKAIKMDDKTVIKQDLVVECNALSQIQVWVKSYQPVEGLQEFLILETRGGEILREVAVKSEDIPTRGWLIFDLAPTMNQRNQELQFRILSKGQGGIPQLELARFPTNEYSRGTIVINGRSYSQDLVFQYNCQDGISNLWR